ncbi:MAG: ribonuclease HII [Oligoflexia bacterium]|nr:ribonuclease HII [Oligoflexia bacterium]
MEPVNWQSFGESLCAGVDEVGRGCLAGPVYAAAVILPPNFELPELTDSKLLTPPVRSRLAVAIKSQAVAWAIESASIEEIEKINILHASLLAMKRAVEALNPKARLALIDGNRPVTGLLVSQKTIVKGDLRCLPISAASVLAKVARDELMNDYNRLYPGFGFDENKGYGTPIHRQAIEALGPTPIHRRLFSGVKEFLHVQYAANRNSERTQGAELS